MIENKIFFLKPSFGEVISSASDRLNIVIERREPEDTHQNSVYMKGATALPWVSTINPPKTTIIISTGSSQYFLRTCKNRNNSSKNDIGPLLELIRHPRTGHPSCPRRVRAVAARSSSYRLLNRHSAAGLFRTNASTIPPGEPRRRKTEPARSGSPHIPSTAPA